MIHFVRVCGLFGSLILVLTGALAITGIFVACFARRRAALGVLAVAALLPFGLGLAGTAVGNAAVASMREAMESPDRALIEHGRREARYTSYLGAGCTVVLWLICGVGAAAKGAIAEPERGPRRT
jgi:hypothetical protein